MQQHYIIKDDLTILSGDKSRCCSLRIQGRYFSKHDRKEGEIAKILIIRMWNYNITFYHCYYYIRWDM